MSGTRSTSTREPATEAPPERAALVVCSYGGSTCAVHDRVRALGRSSGFSEAAAATLYGAPRIEEVVTSLRGSPIFVVPLFMAAGVTYAALTHRLAELRCSDRIVLCPELGCHPGLAGRLAAHAVCELGRVGWHPEETGLVLIGHGSRRNAASENSTERLAEEIRRLALFADASAAFLEVHPTIPEAVRSSPARRVLAVGCFVEAGRHATRDVPISLTQSGRTAIYCGPIGQCDWIASMVLDQAMAGLRQSVQLTARFG
jgi:sirohydrochlorin cobaltochelatase